MKLTLSIDDGLAKRARERAGAMGKSLEQLVGEYLEQLADAEQAERDVEEWRRLSREAQGDRRGWTFNREEIYDRYDCSKAGRRGESGEA